jgi:hypothetical protein
LGEPHTRLPHGPDVFRRRILRVQRSQARACDSFLQREGWIAAVSRITTSKHGGSTRRQPTSDGTEVEMSTESRAQIHRWRAFAVLAVSFFMTIVDLTIVNVALPTIGRELHLSESNLQWVVTA